MKTFLKITALLGLLMSLCCLTSCGKDEEDDFAAEIAGTYLGENDFKAISAYVDITKVSEKTVRIKYDNSEGETKSEASFTKASDVSFTNVKVTKSGSTYNLSGTDGLDGEIKGTVNGTELNMQVEYNGVRSFIFQGYKQ